MKLTDIFTQQEIRDFHMTQVEVAKALFINPDTVLATEKRALEKMRKAFKERGIEYKDLI